MAVFSNLLIDSRSDAFLQATNLALYFKDKKSQGLAFKLLTIFLTKACQPQLVEQVFTAQIYWHANVNFQSCIEKIKMKCIDYLNSDTDQYDIGFKKNP